LIIDDPTRFRWLRRYFDRMKSNLPGLQEGYFEEIARGSTYERLGVEFPHDPEAAADGCHARLMSDRVASDAPLEA